MAALGPWVAVEVAAAAPASLHKPAAEAEAPVTYAARRWPWAQCMNWEESACACEG